jgi:hypothetical protein
MNDIVKLFDQVTGAQDALLGASTKQTTQALKLTQEAVEVAEKYKSLLIESSHLLVKITKTTLMPPSLTEEVLQFLEKVVKK